MEQPIELLDITLRSRQTGSWINQDDVDQVKRFHEFRTVDWVEDELNEHSKRLAKHKTTGAASFRNRIYLTTQTWLLLALMGVLIGLIAGFLNIITAWLGSLRLGRCSSNFYLSKQFCCWGQTEEFGSSCKNWNDWSGLPTLNYILYVLISLAFLFALAVLVKQFSAAAAGSGISEIKCIVSGFVMEGFLGWWTLLVKSIGLPLAIASGLSVGKEGPSVHYAVCVGNNITKLASLYRKLALKGRTFLTATAAAGVAVAFGSPMGGVLFSIEEISTVFELSTIWKSYFCSLVAVTTLAAMNPFRTGQLVLFEVSYDTNWHYFEIPLYIIIGIFGGVYGIVVSHFNIRVVLFRKRYLKNFAIREVLILSLLTTSFSYFNEFLKGDMTETMDILFHQCNADFQHPICHVDTGKAQILSLLLFATIARMGLTIITYGCKVPAGIFVPLMAAGATFARALGILVDKFYQSHPESSVFAFCPTNAKCIIPGTYAFLGAAAALCGITDLSVTVVIIMFELTGALRYIIPTMIVVAITKSINHKWGKGGIADQMIKFNGLPRIDAKEEFSFNTSVEGCMTTIVVTVPSSTPITLSKFRTILSKTGCRGFPLIKSPSDPKISGFVLRADILLILEGRDDSEDTLCYFGHIEGFENGIDFTPIVNSSPLTININVSLEYVLDIFVKVGPRYILVQNNDSLLTGIITRKDILRFEYTVHHIQNSDHEQQKRYGVIEEKVWNMMVLLQTNFKRNMGKLFFNDDQRFL